MKPTPAPTRPPPRRRFQITLEQQGDDHALRGLKRWLIRSWRAYAMKCIALAELPPVGVKCRQNSPPGSPAAEHGQGTDAAEAGQTQPGDGSP